MIKAKDGCVSKMHISSSIPLEDQTRDSNGEPSVVDHRVVCLEFTHRLAGFVHRAGPVRSEVIIDMKKIVIGFVLSGVNLYY